MTHPLLTSSLHIVHMACALACIAARAHASDDPWTQHARYSFEYRVEVVPPDGRTVRHLRLWVPHPALTEDQRLLSADIDAPWTHRLTRDAFGNQMVYLEGTGLPPRPLVMRFVIERAPSDGLAADLAVARSPDDPERFRKPTRLVPLADTIRAIAEQESRGRTSDAEKVRAFYDYVVRNMRYDKSGTGWGRGDAVWACSNKRGNCTDFHSLLIAMALSQGIPARFIIGFPIPATGEEGEIPGYHCWAEYFDRDRGWVPLDSSEAKKSGRPDDYFGKLPNDRIQFTIGRDLRLDPPQEGPPLNYFIYPYAEADGTPLETVQARFHYRRLPGTVARR
jgi:transglutaminase-like putative cysteine protease